MMTAMMTFERANENLGCDLKSEGVERPRRYRHGRPVRKNYYLIFRFKMRAKFTVTDESVAMYFYTILGAISCDSRGLSGVKSLLPSPFTCM